jgi:hypothetical protein
MKQSVSGIKWCENLFKDLILYSENMDIIVANSQNDINSCELIQKYINKLANCYTKIDLIRLYYSFYGMTKYRSMEEAIDYYAPGKILIYFIDIKLYGLFWDGITFNLFIKKCVEVGIKPNLQQIYPCSEKQKFNFLCCDKIKKDRIFTLTRRFFESDIIYQETDNYTKITVVNKILDDFGQSYRTLSEFLKYIFSTDIKFALSMHNTIYREQPIGNFLTFNYENIAQLINVNNLTNYMPTIFWFYNKKPNGYSKKVLIGSRVSWTKKIFI